MSQDPFLLNILTGLEAQITAAMATSLEASEDGIYSYTFNTSQTTQTVTKNTLGQLQAHIDSLLARRDTLMSRLGLSNSSFQAIPNW